MGTPKQVQEAGDKALADLKVINGKTEEAPKEPDVNGESPPVVPETPEHTETVETLQHKYSVLQGKYNKEVKELKEDIGVLNRQKNEIRNLQKSYDEQLKRNQELTLLVADIQKQITKPKEEKAEVLDFIPSEYLTEAELGELENEDLTPKTLKMLGKMFQGIAKKSQPPTDSNKDEWESKFKELGDRITKTETETVKTKDQSFMQSVEYRVTGVNDPDKATKKFDEINTSQKFINWLKQDIPYSGMTIGKALNDAGKRQDVSAVVKIFRDYLDSATPPAPKAKNPLEKELEPKPRTDGAPTPDTNATDAMLVKKWKAPEAVREFYTDVTMGKYRGKNDERKKIESEIWRVNQILLKH